MAKFIHNGLFYDTEKMKYVGTLEIPHRHYSDYQSIYKSAKGNFLLIDVGEETSHPITEEELRKCIEETKNLSLYKSVFGEIEEA